MPESDQQSPHNRRAMFRLGLKKIMDPLAEYLSERLAVSLPVIRDVLRPPGALPEREFLTTCYRCGNCIQVCPAKAIRVRSAEDPEQAGTPYIDPDLSACVVCDEQACMKACPSGALKLPDAGDGFRMGTARIRPNLCLREKGQECRLCVDKCPIGVKAIGLDAMQRVNISPEGCVGCGSCQFYCPTMPKTILIVPR